MIEMDSPPRIITFDCYGTLVRWHEAVRDGVRDIVRGRPSVDLPEDGIVAIADRLRELAGERQQQAHFLEYGTVLRASLKQAMSEASLAMIAADVETLRARLVVIPPHPEVPAALARLRARYRIAIISNTADDLIAGTVRAIRTPIDCVITAEQARAYKPDPRLFLHAYSTMGVAKEDTIHVGMGQFTDLKVCHELGVRSVWINRLGECLNPAWAPNAVLKDLTELPELLSTG